MGSAPPRRLAAPRSIGLDTYLGYAARGANAWWRYGLGVVLAFALAMLIALLAATALTLTHVLPADFAEAMLDPSHPISFFLTNGALFGLLTLAFTIAIRILHGKRFGDIVGAWSWPLFGMGLAGWAGVLVVLALIDLAIAPTGFRFSATSQTPRLLLVALGGLAVQTFAEEFIFRGYITQGLLLATRRAIPAALISGALFGAMHIPNGGPQAASAAVFGVVMALVAIRTGGIAFTWGLHLTNNLFAAVLLVSDGDAFQGSPGVFTQDTPQLMWWDAVVGAVALIVVALVMDRLRVARSMKESPT